MEAAKERAHLLQWVSDCDDEEFLKRSRHEKKRKVIDSTSEDSDGDSQENKTIKKKSSYKLKMPSNISMSLNAKSNVFEKKLVTANTGKHIVVLLIIINSMKLIIFFDLAETNKQSHMSPKENKKETPSTSETNILPRNSFFDWDTVSNNTSGTFFCPNCS